MSPRFGRSERSEPSTGSRDDVLRAEGDRLEALSTSQLAAEVMAKAFGPDGPRAPDRATVDGATIGAGPTVSAIVSRFVGSDKWDQAKREDSWERLKRLIAEGLQILEHAALVRAQVHSGILNYALTRSGQAALEQGAVERILEGDRP
ncbi:MAG TPA: hypothetical protein VGH14_12470 [Solirubrobacterales bacterium]